MSGQRRRQRTYFVATISSDVAQIVDDISNAATVASDKGERCEQCVFRVSAMCCAVVASDVRIQQE
jgi:hypothetical protein